VRFSLFVQELCTWTSSDAAFLFSVVLGRWFLYFPDIETNECLENNGGCWLDKATNVSACKVQFFFSFKSGRGPGG
jgi:hypothetical protein